MSLIAKFEALENRVRQLEAIVGATETGGGKPKMEIVKNSNKHTYRNLIMQVLSDGSEKTVCEIVKAANKIAGQRQYKPGIHAECSKMKNDGLIKWVAASTYKAA